jgi:hypothetical protein
MLMSFSATFISRLGVDLAAAEFRRRQPKTTRAAAEKNVTRRQASRIFCPPP